MSAASVLKDMKQLVGTEVFLSGWKEITQEQINQFADCTSDHQWIHVDVEKAAKGPYGKTVAHGYLTLSSLPFFTYQMPIRFEGSLLTLNYGLNKVRFLNPVVSGSQIRDRIVLADVEERPNNRLLVTLTHTVEINGQDKPACVADGLLLVIF